MVACSDSSVHRDWLRDFAGRSAANSLAAGDANCCAAGSLAADDNSSLGNSSAEERSGSQCRNVFA